MCILTAEQLIDNSSTGNEHKRRAIWAGDPTLIESGSVNQAEMKQWLQALLEPGQVVELRALRVDERQDGYEKTMSGFFDTDHLDQMIQEAIHLTHSAEGIYFTLNPLDPDLLYRCHNRVKKAAQGDQACDQNVLRRRWLLIDADPQRLSGISASEDEKQLAYELLKRVRGQLDHRGWPEPVVADSGNGYHLLYRVDLPRDDQGLVRRVLSGLAQQFDTAEVKIDQKVFNPSRIVKLYGTLARKGADTTDRPHRWTRVLDLPGELKVVDKQLLEDLAIKEIGLSAIVADHP